MEIKICSNGNFSLYCVIMVWCEIWLFAIKAGSGCFSNIHSLIDFKCNMSGKSITLKMFLVWHVFKVWAFARNTDKVHNFVYHCRIYIKLYMLDEQIAPPKAQPQHPVSATGMKIGTHIVCIAPSLTEKDLLLLCMLPESGVASDSDLAPECLDPFNTTCKFNSNNSFMSFNCRF